ADLSVGELHAAASLRERVFYLEQHVTTLGADEKDPFSLFLWAECEGQTVGFLRMIPRGIAYAEPSIGRVCVARTYRRRGICREMVSRDIGYMVREWRAD
ncbi:GNAT family N-acetyltransferase, partial [Alistipes putredinis]|uniref:GNAT family N-acetyltransferase n=1 Tax=Alistipes putredinis TaxID=28117 RepID=UPI0023AE9444